MTRCKTMQKLSFLIGKFNKTGLSPRDVLCSNSFIATLENTKCLRFLPLNVILNKTPPFSSSLLKSSSWNRLLLEFFFIFSQSCEKKFAIRKRVFWTSFKSPSFYWTHNIIYNFYKKNCWNKLELMIVEHFRPLTMVRKFTAVVVKFSLSAN